MPRRSARLLALSALALLVLGPGVAAWVQLAWRRHALARQQRQLQTTHDALETEQQRLTSDPVYVEGLIRSTFKVAKPTEMVVPLSADSDSHRRR